MNMRVMIFEPQFVGHNLAYVRHIASRLVEMGCEVHLLTSQQAAQSEEFAKHLADVIDSIHVTAPNTFVTRGATRGVRVNGPAAILAIMQSLMRGLKGVRPEHLFIPFGNPVAHWAALPNPVSRWLTKHRVESELVLLTGKYAYPHRDVRSAIKQRVALHGLELGPWTRIHHIVPHALKVMQGHSSRLATLARLSPDPIDAPFSMTRLQAREMLGLNPEHRVVSLVGLIESRKGIRELLTAFEHAIPRLRSTDRLLLAGKSTDETRLLLSTRFGELVRSNRILGIDRHLSARELWAACIASNLMTTPYPNHLYSASIVIRAAAARVPVLANQIGWMGDVVQRFQLGTTCDTNCRDTFSDRLVDALDRSPLFRPTRAAERFVAFHSIENFASRITERVAQRLGQTSEEGLRWDDVLEAPHPQSAAA